MKQGSINKLLGARIRTLRLARGWSQEELGERAHLDRTYVSGVERGVRNPTVTVLEALANGLNVHIAALFNANEEVDDGNS